MRALVLSSLLLFVLFFAASAYALFIHAPKIAQQNISDRLSAIGIEASDLGKPEIHFKSIIYKNVKLDKEDFSSIETLKVGYSPVKLIAFGEVERHKLSALVLQASYQKTAHFL